MILPARSTLTIRRLALVVAILLCTQISAAFAVDAAVKGQNRQLLKKATDEIRVGRPEAALVDLQTVLDTDPANPDAHFLMGQVKYLQGALAEATEILVQGMALAPLSSRIKLLLAKIKLAQENPVEAEALITEVLSIKPNDIEALYLMGNVALAGQDTTRALDFWQAALSAELGIEAP